MVKEVNQATVLSNSPKSGAGEGNVQSTAVYIPIDIKDGGKEKKECNSVT